MLDYAVMLVIRQAGVIQLFGMVKVNCIVVSPKYDMYAMSCTVSRTVSHICNARLADEIDTFTSCSYGLGFD